MENPGPIIRFRPSPYPADDPLLSIEPKGNRTVKIRVNKDTHRIVYTGETEHEVVVEIIPKQD